MKDRSINEECDERPADPTRTWVIASDHDAVRGEVYFVISDPLAKWSEDRGTALRWTDDEIEEARQTLRRVGGRLVSLVIRRRLVRR